MAWRMGGGVDVVLRKGRRSGIVWASEGKGRV